VTAMLRAEGIDPERLDYRPYNPPGMADLVSRRVDVIPGRSLAIPWLARQAGVQLNVVRPLAYGIDFYGDTLFTHRDLVKRDPALVERFRAASIKGWAYAFEHIDEIAERIGRELPRTVPLGNPVEYNKFEAGEVKALAVYPVIELGHMNPDRWRRMYELLKLEGAVSTPFDADDFIFDCQGLTQEARARYLQFAAIALVSLLAAGILILSWNRSLRRQVVARTTELRQSEERFALAEAGSNEGIWDWDLATGRTYYSPRFGELFGYSPWEMGDQIETWQGLVHPDDMPGLQRDLEAHFAGKTPRYVHEYRLKHKDGSRRKILGRAQAIRDETGKPYRLVGSVADVTAQRTLEQQLVQAQKMEAVGQLTGGLAHDFNNRLAAIVTNLELLEEQVGENSEARTLIASAMRSADRGTDLTRRLLVFSRSNELQPVSVDVNRTILDMTELLRRTLRESIELEAVVADQLWLTNVDPGQLENAILNLALNARDAMRGGGKLTLETANVELDLRYAAQHADLRAGEYVMLAVTDTGTGMTPEVMVRAFEPFFTTKSLGHGSGLGLSMIYGFIKRSGGHVKIYSEPGIGTTVKMYLPRALHPEAAEPAAPAPARERKGVETILVVEDDGE
ncbi:MAG TPA: PAS domain-containing protein, partial [Sphingomicrobium sp.]